MTSLVLSIRQPFPFISLEIWELHSLLSYVIRRFMLHGTIPLSHHNPWWQASNQKAQDLSYFIQKMPRHRMWKMWCVWMVSLSQHCYFIDDKSFVNDESLQIYKRRYDYDEQFFETAPHFSFFLSLLNTCWRCNLHHFAHYFDNGYSITRSCMMRQ